MANRVWLGQKEIEDAWALYRSTLWAVRGERWLDDMTEIQDIHGPLHRNVFKSQAEAMGLETRRRLSSI